MYQLPAWLQERIPEVTLPALISCKDNVYRVTSPDGLETEACGTFFDALAYAKATYPSNYDFVIATFALEPHMNEQRGRIHVHNKDGSLTVYSPYSQKQRLKWLSNEYENAIFHANEYSKDPKDFMKSYDFISQHPVFWITRNKTPGEKTFDWNTQYNERLIPYPRVTKAKRDPDWVLDGGPHLKPDYSTNSTDLKLTTIEPTIEQAYIGFAEKLKMFYTIDGAEIENVAYEKTKYHKKMEELFDKHLS